MEHPKNQNISLSTLYRYTQVNRQSDLPVFGAFQQQFHAYFDSKKISSIKRVYQHGICGRNHNNQTVIVDRVGNIKIMQLSKVFEDDELVYYFNQRLLHLSEELLQQKEQIVWIVDLSGKIMQLASKRILDWIKKIIVNAQKYFPNMLAKLVFVNTPMLFDTIWSKITPFIDEKILDKVVMIGDELQNLEQFASRENLPDFLGGDIEEELFLRDGIKQQKAKEEEEEESDEQQVDFASLRQALTGLKIGGSSVKSVSQTPLNTEADQK